MIARAVESVQLAAQSKAVRIEWVVDSTAGPVTGDPSRMQQVVWNLLNNAIKFAPRGKVQIVLERASSHVELSISDTGRGIVRISFRMSSSVSASREHRLGRHH